MQTFEPTIPAEVPAALLNRYLENLGRATYNTGNLLLFAGDQKVEHMNDDYFGEGITPENADPEHMFKIASQAQIGCFAAQLGLISRYGNDYPTIPYLVKMNSKSNLVPTSQAESISRQWCTMEQLDEFMVSSRLNIVGVGYTIYVGSEHESFMYSEAARLIFDAHRRGLFTVLWMYPRGKAVPNEKDPHIVAGAAGIGATLGSDFVKVNYPHKDGVHPAEGLKEAVLAAGRTKVICAGGGTVGAQEYFQMLHDQMHISGAHGTAAGRNIHQRPLEEAIRFTNACHAIIIEEKSVEEAMAIYNGGGSNETLVQ